MVTCPACGAPVNADFGMVSCSKCETVFIVEIDGSVTLPSAESAENVEYVDEAEASSAAEEPISYEEPPAEENNFQVNEEPLGESVEDYQSLTDEPVLDSNEGQSDFSDEGAPSEPVEEVSAEAETEYSEDFMDNLNDAGMTQPVDTADDPLGVSRFDGAEASQMADGPYYYDVRVSGVDTATIKQQVVDVLSDKRLNWSSEEIKKQIRNGQLILEKLNPVRAVLVVLRLQSLDVDVEWDQRPYTDESESAKDSQDQET